MGLIQAALAAAGGVLGDQWKEFFYCDSLSSDILVAKGHRRKSSSWSSNDGSDNIITNGSKISVNDGQCMMIVQQGKVIDFCADSGEYIYDKSTEPSLFNSKKTLAEDIQDIFFAMKDRFGYGGDAGRDERIYYFNTKEIVGNKYGTPTPIPFRVVDYNIGLDVDIAIKCFGSYSYRIVNPILFYKNVCGNVTDTYNRSTIDGQLKTELMTALQPAFAKISEKGIRYSALPAHTQEIADALNEVLSKKWGELRGLQIVSFGVSNVSANEEDAQMIKEMQRNGALRNPLMAAAHLTGAQADAMRDAANNSGGAMTGFMGMGMAQQAGGINAGNLFAMGQQQTQQQNRPATWKCSACGHDGNRGTFCSECGAKKPVVDEWKCECGAVNKGKFCAECGKPKPASSEWKCECGATNKGRFCAECGKPKP
ncbi:MAG: SPFH domain-containing protein [Selenomonadaceae bacterium]|nr:SPFH domain-containing protein [Selenomonadaceae bacterium]